MEHYYIQVCVLDRKSFERVANNFKERYGDESFDFKVLGANGDHAEYQIDIEGNMIVVLFDLGMNYIIESRLKQ